MKKLAIVLLCGFYLSVPVTLLTSCKDNRQRTGKQGDVGAGGIQTPNPSDSTVNRDTMQVKTDTGLKGRRVE